MEKTILEQLNILESTENMRIIMASESGSCAWGFHSGDSDYDVRFVYARPAEWYLGLGAKRDVIELPVDDLLDVNGWDVQKAGAGNPPNPRRAGA